MTDVDTIRLKLGEQLLTSFRQEYSDAVDTWRTLEGKAQISITIAGVFLAAVFAFARDLKDVSLIHQILLGGSVVSLVLAVVFGLLVFRIVVLVAPPLGTFTETGVFDIIRQVDAEVPAYLQRFVRDQCEQWKEALQSIVGVNNKKASAVWRAQVSLIVGICLTALFTITRVVGL